MKKSINNTTSKLNNFSNFEIKKDKQNQVKGGTIIVEIEQI